MFELVKNDPVSEALLPEAIGVPSGAYPLWINYEKAISSGGSNTGADSKLLSAKDGRSKSKPSELYKRRTVAVRRETFLDVACSALSEYKYVGPNQRADLMLACR